VCAPGEGGRELFVMQFVVCVCDCSSWSVSASGFAFASASVSVWLMGVWGRCGVGWGAGCGGADGGECGRGGGCEPGPAGMPGGGGITIVTRVVARWVQGVLGPGGLRGLWCRRGCWRLCAGSCPACQAAEEPTWERQT
jgi:hypothetical protein